MADELTCTSEAIHKFLVDNGGKVSNQELVKYFKKFLSGPNSRPDARAIFKDYVNAVASIKVEDGVKYIVLKKRGYEGKSDTSSSSEQISEESQNDSKKCRLSDDKEPAKNKETSNQSNILHSHSSPSILGMASPQVQNADHAVSSVTSPIFWSSDLPPGHVPQPPPRRKYSMKGKENRGTKYEESIRQIYEEKETTTSPRNEEIREVVSPGSVKEKAHLLNKMATESDLVPKQPYVPSRRREHRDDKSSEDDASSISTLDPRRKEWILKASRADYHELVRLLREEPNDLDTISLRDMDKQKTLGNPPSPTSGGKDRYLVYVNLRLRISYVIQVCACPNTTINGWAEEVACAEIRHRISISP
ncbi:hypothetical protein AVEN_248009-1 [Araneus ventricosus]|uniref:SOWAHA-C winged helix-turn-helix domain-containing protein n=1 Tax=Araneus ventricosus TaxID=182803 RepID=A0A4Y2JFS7_ARAVE|nr:hypothetical protein AVEN_248009-1 [Araneus ventricosus]